jgi:hypothetical protein
MPDESYAESVRAVIIENGIEVATLGRIKELVLVHRQRRKLLRPDDMEPTRSVETDLRWEHRVRSALMELRRNGECALIGRAKYRFFL